MKKTTFLLISSIFFLSLIFPFQVYSIGIPGFSLSFNNYFGGKVTGISYCTCFYDPATILSIDDKKSNSTLKLKYSVWSSKLYKYYNIFGIGQYVLGSYSPGNATCLNTVSIWPPVCESGVGLNDGVINRSPGVGTSLY